LKVYYAFLLTCESRGVLLSKATLYLRHYFHYNASIERRHNRGRRKVFSHCAV
jgi:hypothetical protein